MGAGSRHRRTLLFSLRIIFLGIGLFLVAFASHIAVWRIVKPSKQMLWLTIVFIVLPIGGWLIFSAVAGPHSEDGAGWTATPLDTFLILLLNLLLSAAYIMSYPPIQAGCPSLKIILAVNDSRAEGMTAEAIHRIFSEDILVSERLEDMVNDGLIFVKRDIAGDDLVSLKNETIVISWKGYLIAQMFALYRRILNLPLGKG